MSSVLFRYVLSFENGIKVFDISCVVQRMDSGEIVAIVLAALLVLAGGVGGARFVYKRYKGRSSYLYHKHSDDERSSDQVWANFLFSVSTFEPSSSYFFFFFGEPDCVARLSGRCGFVVGRMCWTVKMPVCTSFLSMGFEIFA